MKLKKAIRQRRSVYTGQFSGKKVDQKVIETMLELANWAPTHKHTEPWRFKVYEGDALIELIDKLSDIYIKTTPSEHFNPGKVDKWQIRKQQLSHVIIIVMDRSTKTTIPEFEETSAVAMAVQNAWLYLSSTKENGGYWSTPSMVFEQEFADYINLADNQKCMGMFMVGKVDAFAIKPSGKRGNWKDKVEWFKN